MSTPSPDASMVQHRVHIGFWTNWSRGSVFGATVTLSRDNGNLLIAFTAFFVGLVAARFWRIICLVLHRWFSTPESRDALHHQRQVILRNSESAESAFWSLSQLFWAWRRTNSRSLSRVLPSFTVALFCAVAFTVASGFSSKVSTGIGNEVLIDGRYCGLVLSAGDSQVQSINQTTPSMQIYEAGQVNNAANYAQQCYSSSSPGMFDCSSFVTSRLPANIDTHASCPFKEQVCRTKDSNIHLDTGYLDSDTHLGLNAPPDERFLFRHVFHCAPLVTEGHTSEAKGNNITYARYHYGSAIMGPADQKVRYNYTFEIESLEFQYGTQLENNMRNRGRTLRLETNAFIINGTVDPISSFFAPSEELERSDGDILLLFLSGNGAFFQEEVDDDWYRATDPGPGLVNTKATGTHPLYQSSEAASPMGCVSQYQFCNPALPKETQCGPLASQDDATRNAFPLFNLAEDTEIFAPSVEVKDKVAGKFLWFVKMLNNACAPPWFIVDMLGSNALDSQKSFEKGFQAMLPTNQWQLDMTKLWFTWLAALQSGIVDVANGADEQLYGPIKLPPNNTFEGEVCNSQQKIQSSEYTSFSVFGLCFVFVMGTAIVLVSYTLEPLSNYYQKRHGRRAFADFEWTSNGTLQLHSLGYEVLGRGSWSVGPFDVPLTKRGEVLEPIASHQSTDMKLTPQSTKTSSYETKEDFASVKEEKV
ncbi:hypothetical protein GQ53DRAFT_882709 [Thozetella sp. PMI_491]|nr:hypothetical protein GQ53DRAFT_882709 [Thozetella sp. PMI_491]